MEIKEVLRHPRKIIYSLGMKGKLRFIPDKPYIKLMYWANTGKKLNLKSPRTYNEKLQWLKLYDRNPAYTKMVDKYEAKKYVASIIGEEYIIPTLGVWERFDDIDFNLLPEQFVLKCTHDSGGLVICKDKGRLNIQAAKDKITSCLKKNYFIVGREYPYKAVKPRIIAEKYMQESAAGEALTDYKFFCFNGKPQIVYISKDKAAEPRTDFFDMEYNLLPIKMRDPNSDVPPQMPNEFEEMKKMAATLSAGFKHFRVDFYIVNHKIFVGELTFYHNSGFSEVKPSEWNLKLGEMIEIDY